MVRDRRRDRKSYISKDPEKRARQMNNLIPIGRPKGSKNTVTISKERNDRLQAANIIEFATLPEFLGLNLHPGQETILRAQYGLPIPEHLMPYYTTMTGMDKVYDDGRPKSYGVWNCGNRAGKSRMVSIIALYESTRDYWRQFLEPGEFGYFIVIACKKEQAVDIIQTNCRRMLDNSGPDLKWVIEDSLKAEIVLKNGIKIKSFPCNTTAILGLPAIGGIMDECAFYFVEGPNADEQVYASLRPRMAQFGKWAKMLFISSPAAKQGLFWDWYSRGFDVDNCLTVHAPTRLLNPDIPESEIEDFRATYPELTEMKYDAKFAETLSMYFPSDKINGACILAGEAKPEHGQTYYCGIDQSGLAGKDRFAMAISHMEPGSKRVIVDVCRSWDSKDLDPILDDIQTLARRYWFSKVHIDNYAKGFMENALNKIGLEVNIRERLPVVYSNLKSLLISGRIRMIDDKELKLGLSQTSAAYGRNNTLSIDHPRNSKGHGDLADAVATSTYYASVIEEFRHRRVVDLRRQYPVDLRSFAGIA